MRARTRSRHGARLLSCLASLTLGASGCQCTGADDVVTLAAASSLRNVVPALLQAHQATPGAPAVRVTYGPSGDLRRQVEGGAPIAGVLFAISAPVDSLVAKGLADPQSRRTVATNELVLIAPKVAGEGSSLTFETLATLPAGAKLAVGDPDVVPAGMYAREALQRLGIWGALRDRLVFGGDVAMVLAYARRGEVAAAIVYGTEVDVIDDVVVLDRATGPWAPRPEVISAVTSDGAEGRAAASFLDFVASPAGQAILARHGFGPPPGPVDDARAAP